MRILFAGTPAVAVPTLDALVAAGHEIVAVLTRADAPGKRGKRLIPSPVALRAAELGLPTLKPAKARAPEVVAQVRDFAPECCVVVAYGQIISAEMLAIPTHGWINLHFSLLPRWRGAAPVQRALMAGDEVTGACVFELVPELDAGPVYDTLIEPLSADDTADAVLARLAGTGAELVTDVLSRIDAGERPIEQSDDGVTLAPKLTVVECELDLARPAADLDRLIRGASSNPGAWTTFRGERFKVLGSRVVDSSDLAPGQLRATKRALLAGTGDGALELTRVQAFGKKEMAGADWARGIDLTDADRLGA